MIKVREWVYNEADGWEHKVDFWVGDEEIEAHHPDATIQAYAQHIAETDDTFMAHLLNLADAEKQRRFDEARTDYLIAREAW